MENRIDSKGPDPTKDEAFIDTHPLGAGSGAAAGFTAGALLGTSVGPLGTTVGATGAPAGGAGTGLMRAPSFLTDASRC
jgi:hypothetical protein